MDKQAIAVLIPIFALTIPIVAIVFHGLQKIARMRLEEARLRAGYRGRGGDQEDIAMLHDEVAALRQELTDVHERLDFAERLLTRERERAQLSPGAGA